jgi:hypothetical protein
VIPLLLSLRALFPSYPGSKPGHAMPQRLRLSSPPSSSPSCLRGEKSPAFPLRPLRLKSIKQYLQSACTCNRARCLPPIATKKSNHECLPPLPPLPPTESTACQVRQPPRPPLATCHESEPPRPPASSARHLRHRPPPVTCARHRRHHRHLLPATTAIFATPHERAPRPPPPPPTPHRPTCPAPP